ncbi:hypothetical protein 12VC501_gene0037 [Vibrio phage 12VC501]|nr:hypothetical protein 12VC501_gene0037 [Vibrio phage 12VC501]
MKLFPTYKNDYDSAMIEFVTNKYACTLYWDSLETHKGDKSIEDYKNEYCKFRITKDSNETT